MEHRHVLMGKSTISMAMFNSKLLVYQALQHQDPTLAHFYPFPTTLSAQHHLASRTRVVSWRH